MIGSDASELLLVKILDYCVANVRRFANGYYLSNHTGFIKQTSIAARQRLPELENRESTTRSDVYLFIALRLVPPPHGTTYRFARNLEQILSAEKELPLEQSESTRTSR